MKTDTKRWRWIGWRPTGDIGPWTMYTSRRGRLVVFPQAPPLSPPTAEQLQNRQHFRDAAKLWWLLTPAERTAYELAALACSIQCTGYNLWVRTCFTGDGSDVRAIARQSGRRLRLPDGSTT